MTQDALQEILERSAQALREVRERQSQTSSTSTQGDHFSFPVPGSSGPRPPGKSERTTQRSTENRRSESEDP